MKTNIMIILLFSLLWGMPLLLTGEPLTLEECLNKSMAQNPGIEKARKSVDEAIARCYQGYANFLPTLSIGGQLVHLNNQPPAVDFISALRPGGTMPRLAGNPLLQYAFQDNYTAYFRINEQLFTGGRNLAQLNSYKSDYRAKKAELKNMESKTKVEVVKAFYAIIIQKELRSLAKEAVRQIERHLESVKQSFKAGGSTEYDVLRTEVQLLSWTSRLTKTDKDLANSFNRLGLLLGRARMTNTDISGELSEPSEESGPELTLEQARDKALAQRPEIEAQRAIKEMSGSMKKIKVSALLPQINLQYNYYYQNIDDSFTFKGSGWEKWWDVRLNFSWEIFSFGKRVAEIRESGLKKEGTEIDEQALEDRIRTEVEDAYRNLGAVREDVKVARKNLDLARLSLQMARDKSKTGAVTEIDVLDSEVALVDARVQYLKSLYDFKTAESEFQKALGQ